MLFYMSGLQLHFVHFIVRAPLRLTIRPPERFHLHFLLSVLVAHREHLSLVELMARKQPLFQRVLPARPPVLVLLFRDLKSKTPTSTPPPPPHQQQSRHERARTATYIAELRMMVVPSRLSAPGDVLKTSRSNRSAKTTWT